MIIPDERKCQLFAIQSGPLWLNWHSELNIVHLNNRNLLWSIFWMWIHQINAYWIEVYLLTNFHVQKHTKTNNNNKKVYIREGLSLFNFLLSKCSILWTWLKATIRNFDVKSSLKPHPQQSIRIRFNDYIDREQRCFLCGINRLIVTYLLIDIHI